MYVPLSPSHETNAQHACPSGAGDRVLRFSGYEWMVKTSDVPVGPGDNFFSDSGDNVFVDDEGSLHLRITRRGQRWHCAEVISVQSFGYGRYRFYLGSNLDHLDPNVILGCFTWNDDPEYNHREIDIEFCAGGKKRTRMPSSSSSLTLSPRTSCASISRRALTLRCTVLTGSPIVSFSTAWPAAWLLSPIRRAGFNSTGSFATFLELVVRTRGSIFGCSVATRPKTARKRRSSSVSLNSRPRPDHSSRGLEKSLSARIADRHLPFTGEWEFRGHHTYLPTLPAGMAMASATQNMAGPGVDRHDDTRLSHHKRPRWQALYLSRLTDQTILLVSEDSTQEPGDRPSDVWGGAVVRSEPVRKRKDQGNSGDSKHSSLFPVPSTSPAFSTNRTPSDPGQSSSTKTMPAALTDCG